MFMYINDDLHKREVLRRSAILVVQPTTKHCLPFYTTNTTKKTVTNKWKNKEKKNKRNKDYEVQYTEQYFDVWR